jgi:hypothetical protein
MARRGYQYHARSVEPIREGPVEWPKDRAITKPEILPNYVTNLAESLTNISAIRNQTGN